MAYYYYGIPYLAIATRSMGSTILYVDTSHDGCHPGPFATMQPQAHAFPKMTSRASARTLSLVGS